MTTRKPPAKDPKPGLNLPPIPSLDDTVFVSAMVVLGATAIIDWPIAVAIGAGHLLTKRLFGQYKKN